MAPLVTELEAAGFEVTVRIEKGHPVTQILKVEKDENVSAVVMGSHGRNDIVDSLIGTVSAKVVRRSATPVLLIKR